MTITCARRGCDRAVTEWLLIRRGLTWDAIACCGVHPAAERAAALRAAGAGFVIVPHPGGTGVPSTSGTMSARDAFLARRDTSPTARYVWHMGRRALIEAQAEIARLRSELDAQRDRVVLHCLDRDIIRAMTDSYDAEEGTIIRTTDTGRELVLADGDWSER